MQHWFRPWRWVSLCSACGRLFSPRLTTRQYCRACGVSKLWYDGHFRRASEFEQRCREERRAMETSTQFLRHSAGLPRFLSAGEDEEEEEEEEELVVPLLLCKSCQRAFPAFELYNPHSCNPQGYCKNCDT